MGKTSIEWADFSWNVTTGCTKLSAGCDRCYAERMARRQVAMGLARHEAGSENDAAWVAYSNAIDPETGRWSGEITCRYDKLSEPLHWKKPRRIFVNSMSDLFHEGVPFEFIERVFGVICNTPQHTYLILTKRHDRMAEIVRELEYLLVGCFDDLFPNVWLGITAENQEWWEKRCDTFFDCPAALHFLSYEPALGPLVFSDDDLEQLDLVIVGGETGPRARLMELDWVRDVRDQCVEANTSFFFKQNVVDGRAISLPELDGKVWNEMPQIATMPQLEMSL